MAFSVAPEPHSHLPIMVLLSRLGTFVLFLVGWTSTALAQRAPEYQASPDTVYLEVANPHLMYFVVGEDTLGNPIEAVTLETQQWTQMGSHLQVVVQQESLLPEASITRDTFQIRRGGEVASINGHAPALHGRVDFLPRLPPRLLSVGMTWSDTLEIRTQGPAGEHVYSILREYRVSRLVDTLGARIVEIDAEAKVRYRDGWWADAAEQAHAWIDVSGPMTERIGFDPARGRIAYRSWWMNLTGEGAIPIGNGGMKQVQAGLISGSRHRIITSMEAAELRRNPRSALRPRS